MTLWPSRYVILIKWKPWGVSMTGRERLVYLLHTPLLPEHNALHCGGLHGITCPWWPRHSGILNPSSAQFCCHRSLVCVIMRHKWKMTCIAADCWLVAHHAAAIVSVLSPLRSSTFWTWSCYPSIYFVPGLLGSLLWWTWVLYFWSVFHRSVLDCGPENLD